MAALILAHMAVVLAVVGLNADFIRFRRLGGLVAGEILEQPWRLLTSLFLGGNMTGPAGGPVVNTGCELYTSDDVLLSCEQPCQQDLGE